MVLSRLPTRPRVALYSHDAQGLGHVRRNLAVAGVLADGGRRDVLLLTGAKEAGVFPTPDGVELLTLPAIAKTPDGAYEARSLALSMSALIRLRSQTICAALDSFAPDVFIVDKLPLGIQGELEVALDVLAQRHSTRFVLGLREVLDDPATVRSEWAQSGAEKAMRERYDAIWVYGDQRAYDPIVEYGLDHDIAEKVRFSGYLGCDPGAMIDGRAREPEVLNLPPGDFALCLVGGGQDGTELATAFARASLREGLSGVIVTGPFMPASARRELDRIAAGRPDLLVLSFLDDPGSLMARAHSVVAMGGYNTVCELLHLGRRTLLVPRVTPRTEQLIRARCLVAHGLVDLLHPAALSPEALGSWLSAEPEPRPHPRATVDLDGLSRLPGLLDELNPPDRVMEGSHALAV